MQIDYVHCKQYTIYIYDTYTKIYLRRTLHLLNKCVTNSDVYRLARVDGLMRRGRREINLITSKSALAGELGQSKLFTIFSTKAYNNVIKFTTKLWNGLHKQHIHVLYLH